MKKQIIILSFAFLMAIISYLAYLAIARDSLIREEIIKKCSASCEQNVALWNKTIYISDENDLLYKCVCYREDQSKK